MLSPSSQQQPFPLPIVLGSSSGGLLVVLIFVDFVAFFFENDIWRGRGRGRGGGGGIFEDVDLKEGFL